MCGDGGKGGAGLGYAGSGAELLIMALSKDPQRSLLRTTFIPTSAAQSGPSLT